MFNLMVWAFITDVIDNEQVENGIREDGLRINSFSRRLQSGRWYSGLLSFIGYKASTTGVPFRPKPLPPHLPTVSWPASRLLRCWGTDLDPLVPSEQEESYGQR